MTWSSQDSMKRYCDVTVFSKSHLTLAMFLGLSQVWTLNADTLLAQ